MVLMPGDRFEGSKTIGWKADAILRSRLRQAKYLYSPDRNNNEWSRSVLGLSLVKSNRCGTFRSSRNGNYFAAQLEGRNTPVPHNGLFSRSLKRRKILRLLFSEERWIYSRRTEMSRCEWCLDKFSTKRYTDGDGGAEARLGNLGPDAGRRKKITVLFNIA